MHTLNSTGRAMALPKRIFAFASQFLFIGFLLIGSHLSAQSVNAYVSPVPLEDDDETTIFIEIGTASAPANDIHSFSAVFAAEGFTMVAASNFNLEASDGWLLGTSFTYDYSINAAGDEITINATRTDEVDQSGYGFVGRGGNVICTIDEGASKNGSEPRLRIVDFRANPADGSPLQIGPNPSHDLIYITHPNAKAIGQIKLYTLEGKMIKQWETVENAIQLDIGELANGFYLLQTKTQGVLRQQKILIRH